MEYTDIIRVGRDTESEVWVTDISVSRLHAFIKRNEEGGFSLIDNNSKFGTLVLMVMPERIEQEVTQYY